VDELRLPPMVDPAHDFAYLLAALSEGICPQADCLVRLEPMLDEENLGYGWCTKCDTYWRIEEHDCISMSAGWAFRDPP
jgi:hypothetical protein